ncbi:ribonuclease P protein component [Porphyromonas gingivicanis]|uniref:ribonuclease P protein component n=1 Tax=Porphyromonas gingivicanis TaxID=266762 RepID=UPI00068F0B05|nr:ribonuclease P protein component [Porphyromonas gingivicanis]
MQSSRLQKSERIYLRDTLRKLFASGDTFVAYPFRVVYRVVRERGREAPLALLISVPKKRFKHAVDRNRLKRLVRESFRLQKAPLRESLEKADTSLHFAVLMIADEMPSYATVYKAMEKILRRLEREWLKREEHRDNDCPPNPSVEKSIDSTTALQGEGDALKNLS